MAPKVIPVDVAEFNGWTIAYEITANGRSVDTNTEVTVDCERGRFRFIRHVTTAAGYQWIDVYGGQKGHETIRSFRPERIRTVHRLNRMRGAV